MLLPPKINQECFLEICRCQKLIHLISEENFEKGRELLLDIMALLENRQKDLSFQEDKKVKKKLFQVNLTGLKLLIQYSDILTFGAYQTYQQHCLGFLNNLRNLLENEAESQRVEVV